MKYFALTYVWICIAKGKRAEAFAMFDPLFLVSSVSLSLTLFFGKCI